MSGGDGISKIDEAIKSLKRGKFVLIYDNENREGETDLIVASEFVTPTHIRTMRKDGGGLIVLMVANDIARKFHLPYLADLYSDIKEKYPIFGEVAPTDIPYDTKSSFSLSINHRNTFTGITDIDRGLTVRRFAEISSDLNGKDNALELFGNEFRSPGHVPICVARDGLLNEREGHTELSVSLLKMAGLTPVATGCEMMGDNGKALSKTDAIKYANRNNLVFLEGREIKEVWKRWSE